MHEIQQNDLLNTASNALQHSICRAVHGINVFSQFDKYTKMKSASTQQSLFVNVYSHRPSLITGHFWQRMHQHGGILKCDV